MDHPGKFAGGKLGEYAYSSRGASVAADRSATEVLKDIVGNVQSIIRAEVRLARAETKEEMGKLFSAGTRFMAGAIVALYGGFFIFLCFVYALSTVMAPWLAALLVGTALAVVGGILLSSGLGRLRQVSPKPEKTIETVKENIEWMKGQSRS